MLLLYCCLFEAVWLVVVGLCCVCCLCECSGFCVWMFLVLFVCLLLPLFLLGVCVVVLVCVFVVCVIACVLLFMCCFWGVS